MRPIHEQRSVRPTRRPLVTLAGVIALMIAGGGAPAAHATDNTAPGAPTLLTPPSGATLSTDAPQLFTIRATDPDGDPYQGWVTVSDAEGPVTTFPTTPALSGDESTGTPSSPLAPGSYTWTARVGDLPFGNRSPHALPQAFSVAGSPDAGGGALTGAVSYTPALPAVGDGCVETQLSLTATSAAAVVTFAPKAFAGFVNFTGSGTSACDGATSGSGTLSLEAEGLGAAATTLDCPELTGQYLHTGLHLRAIASGACSVDGSAPDSVTFEFDLELLPPPGSGITSPLANADLAGRFAIPPAT